MKRTRQPVSFITTDAPKKAETFYSGVMGLTLKERSPYALVYEDGTHTLRIQIVPELTPTAHTAYGWVVPDLATEAKTLKRNGISLLAFDHLVQDKHYIWTTSDGHKIAWFKDPCGNVLSFTQYV